MLFCSCYYGTLCHSKKPPIFTGCFFEWSLADNNMQGANIKQTALACFIAAPNTVFVVQMII
jgi:hypothetical protein